MLAILAQLSYRVGILDQLLPGGLGGTASGLQPGGDADSDPRINFIIGLISNGMILLFVIIIVAGIIYAALAGLKYIQSQGASDKIEEAQNSLKYVLIGVAAVFIGIIGVLIISSAFGDTGDARKAMYCFLSPSEANCKR